MTDEKGHRLLHVSAEFWERLEKLRDRITKRLPPGADPPTLQSLARRAMDLGIHALGRRLAKADGNPPPDGD